jgi:hypothetical protein
VTSTGGSLVSGGGVFPVLCAKSDPGAQLIAANTHVTVMDSEVIERRSVTEFIRFVMV